jgi:potassium channel subfamily K
MNDPGLDEPIEETFGEVTHTLRDQIPHENGSQESLGPRAAFRHELEVDEEEEELGFFQPK